jgi:hypothetical protein
MNTVTFNRVDGGLNKRLPGEDHVSGLIVYGESTVPACLLYDLADFDAIDFDSLDLTPANVRIMRYHVGEFFRVNPGAELYAASFSTTDGSFVEIKQLQQFAQAKIRQVGIVDLVSAFADLTDVSDSIKAVHIELSARKMPLEVMYSNHHIGAGDLPNLPDLRAFNNERFSVVIGQDASGFGNFLSNDLEINVGIIGAALGAVSRAKVNESIGWVEKQNLVTVAYPKALTGGVQRSRELDTPALIDGTLIGNMTPAQVQAINDKGYLFLIKHIGFSGTYFNDSYTATAADSDYATIETNRTIDKAQRGVYVKLLPKISGPVYVDPTTGQLTDDVIGSLESIASLPLEQMQRDGEISGFKVFINPNQNVLSTSQLAVTLKVVPVGVLREIVVNLGFTVQV